jgi:hypothetical protein
MLPAEFSNRRTGTIDSDKGEITDGHLLLNYDIGLMAGAHMHIELKPLCTFYLDTLINGRKTLIGLKEKERQSELIITIYEDFAKPTNLFPANFWADVKNEADLKNVLAIVFSYVPRTE